MLKPGVIDALQRIVGAANLLAELDDRLVYECDGLTMFKATPEAVVFPTSTPQVAEVVRLANRAQVPFVARGGGTGLSGGALAVEGGIMIALTKLNRILEIDLANQRAVVQPGVVNLWITQAVSAQGYYYAPDPSSQQACTIGGNVAENSGGPHTLKYGVTTNHVLGLEIVMPDGRIIDTGGPAEDYPGYDLTGIMVGSEGTLGIVTEVTVRLMQKPEVVKTLMAVFESMDDASHAVSDVIAQGIVPAAIEMMDQLALQAVEAYIHAGYPTDAGAVLLIELDGLRDGMEEAAAQIAEIARQRHAREVRVAADDRERDLLWLGRKRAFGAMGRISPSYYVQDGVIPRTRLPDVLRRIRDISERYAIRIANVFHAGDGNLHPLLLYDERDADQRARVLKASEEILRVCAEVGGSLSGEHGIGVEKRDDMPLVFTELDMDAMLKVRAVFNAQNLCNPGKLFPTPGRCVELGPPVAEKVVGGVRIERF
ncbi:MAG TPA: FAD-linked oxidase C-terminal domain-containing protein [Candidatus Tectomicrobia bacterium]|nr:FAD-linked oxidase C-terminal domain-containing protein [Candidatus Tectomicrobia bacterium]